LRVPIEGDLIVDASWFGAVPASPVCNHAVMCGGTRERQAELAIRNADAAVTRILEQREDHVGFGNGK